MQPVGILNHLKQQEEKVNIRMSLQLIDGGKTPPTGNWLNDLEVGTVFLIKNRKNVTDFNLGLFKLHERLSEKASMLIAQTDTGPKPVYVDPVRFCDFYSLADTVIVEVQQEEQPIEQV